MAQSAALPNAEQLAGSWNEIKGKIREKWGQLSENDLERFKGNVDQLVGHVQQKTGQTRRDVEAFLAEAASSTSGTLQKARDTASEYTSRAAEAVQEQYEQVSEKVSEGYVAAQDMVKRKPVESLGAAFGVGVMCGVLLALVLRSR
ncbi:MAG: CsbD family protein [Pirellulaceae bacterium]